MNNARLPKSGGTFENQMVAHHSAEVNLRNSLSAQTVLDSASASLFASSVFSSPGGFDGLAQPQLRNKQ
jgi:hypothetical protein